MDGPPFALPSLVTLPSPHESAKSSPGGTGNMNPSLSPSSRHPLSRPLSPDLPTKDALYLFANFSSYMRSPEEGAEGIKSSEDFRDAVRLLDYARDLSNQASSNVHVLHLKYRFQGPSATFRSPYSTGDYHLPLNYKDQAGRTRNPVPQPFAVLHDPVIKIDYLETGVFSPLPAQAVFSHIAKACQPAPRIIVVSYVGSKVTENHLASLSTWCLTSSPPSYIFSPLETRIRERQPLDRALHHAIPMSMYAWPAEAPITPALKSPTRTKSGDTHPQPRLHIKAMTKLHSQSYPPPGMTEESPSIFVDGIDSPPSIPERQYPKDPVATLTVITGDIDPAKAESIRDSAHSGRQNQMLTATDRIPLWALAPGVGILHGSTSASIGVKLSDFSAIYLVRDAEIGKTGNKLISRTTAGISTSPFDPRTLTKLSVPPLEEIARPSSTAPASKKMPAVPASDGTITLPKSNVHLTPPSGNSPPDLRVVAPNSWAAGASRVYGWRRGRKETMEDILEELGLGPTRDDQDRMSISSRSRPSLTMIRHKESEEAVRKIGMLRLDARHGRSLQDERKLRDVVTMMENKDDLLDLLACN